MIILLKIAEITTILAIYSAALVLYLGAGILLGKMMRAGRGE